MVVAVDTDDGVELAGHRRVGHVLDDRRAARHEVLLVTLRVGIRLAHGGMVEDRDAAVDRVGEGGREHDAGQRRKTAERGARQVGRLPARQRRVQRGLLAEVDHQGPIVTHCPTDWTTKHTFRNARCTVGRDAGPA